ncbi:hypothetical protein [Photobacterium damselae]|uniref:hypothetical protein n=1 Tax=Photobacterium damselae TaxID=38293 RepID=UPI004069797F
MNKTIRIVKAFFNSQDLKSRDFDDANRGKLKSLTPNLVEFNLLLVPQTKELTLAVSHLYDSDPQDIDFGVEVTITLGVKNDNVIGGCKKPCNLMGSLNVNVSPFSCKSLSLQTVKYHFSPFTPLSINGKDGVFQTKDCIVRFLEKLKCNVLDAYKRFKYAEHLFCATHQNFSDIGVEIDGGLRQGCCDLLVKDSGVRLKTHSDGTVTIEIPEGVVSERQLSKFLVEARA